MNNNTPQSSPLAPVTPILTQAPGFFPQQNASAATASIAPSPGQPFSPLLPRGIAHAFSFEGDLAAEIVALRAPHIGNSAEQARASATAAAAVDHDDSPSPLQRTPKMGSPASPVQVRRDASPLRKAWAAAWLEVVVPTISSRPVSPTRGEQAPKNAAKPGPRLVSKL